MSNVMISPEGKEYNCLIYGVDALRSGWEWYGFEIVEKSNEDIIFFGFVHGDEDEWGNFSLSELRENKVPVYTNPNDIADIAPPVGWTRKDSE